MTTQLEAFVPISSTQADTFARDLWESLSAAISTVDENWKSGTTHEERATQLQDACIIHAKTKAVARAAQKVMQTFSSTKDEPGHWLSMQFSETSELGIYPGVGSNGGVTFNEEDCPSIALLSGFAQQVLEHQKSDTVVTLSQQYVSDSESEATIYYTVVDRHQIIWKEASKDASNIADALRENGNIPGHGPMHQKVYQAIEALVVEDGDAQALSKALNVIRALTAEMMPDQLANVYASIVAPPPEPEEESSPGVKP